MNETQKKIYDYIYKLCNSCVLEYPSGGPVINLPVLLTRHVVAKDLNMSDKTVQRNIEWLVANKYIYKIEFGSNYIYNTIPLKINHDFLCRIKS